MSRLSALLSTAASLAFAAAAYAAPYAMVTDLKGEASAVEGGKARKLSLLGYIEGPVEVNVYCTPLAK